MEVRALKPHLIVIGLLLLTSLALAFTVDVSITDEAGVRTTLPDQVGSWTGEDIFFCLAPACQKSTTSAQVKEPGVCPSCGGRLDSMTLAERQLLPADTVLVKKRYHGPKGETLFASIVMSGRERASIHRPEVCLTGQGSEIIKSHVEAVDIPGRPSLRIMMLDMLRRSPNPGAGEAHSYYAYWFVGRGRETPYHMQRMYWMAADRVFHNRSHRWAYISVAGGRDDKANAHLPIMRDFVAALYPQIVLGDAGAL